MLTSQIASIESCTQRVHDWLLNNGLHLNPSKSMKPFAFYNPRSKPLAALAESIGTISVAALLSSFKHQLKIWVFTLTRAMSFDKQVSETCKACYFHIRALRHIRASLTTEASKTIAAAIVGSRLDFCNSDPCRHIRLKLLHSPSACPEYSCSSGNASINLDSVASWPVLSDLHWLPGSPQN